MEKTAAEVRLSEALRTTKTGPKMWRDLIEAKLMEPARRGSQNAYVITGEQYERLKSIAWARQRIEGRFTLGKLAFTLADEGHRWVPAALVQKEITARVESYFGATRRAFQRYFGLSPQIDRVTESDIYKATEKFAKKVTKKTPARYKPAAFGACYLFLALFLKMMYLKKVNPLDEARGIKELVLQTGAVEHPTKGHVGFSFDAAMRLATQFAATLTGLSAVLSFNGSVNILFNPKSVGRSDADFWRAFDAGERASAIIWNHYDDLRRDVKLQQFSLEDRAKLRALPIAVMIAFQARPPRDAEFLNEMLSGSDQKLEDILRKLLEGIRVFMKLQPLLAAVREKKNVA